MELLIVFVQNDQDLELILNCLPPYEQSFRKFMHSRRGKINNLFSWKMHSRKQKKLDHYELKQFFDRYCDAYI